MRSGQYKRRVPANLQGVVIDGRKLTKSITITLRDGMTRARAMVFTDDLIQRARLRANYRLNDPDAWRMAMDICELAQKTLHPFDRLAGMTKGKYTRDLAGQLGLTISDADLPLLDDWVTRVYLQRGRTEEIARMIETDDPEALVGKPRVDRTRKLVRPVSSVAGRSPLHSNVARDYFAKKRPGNYRRALEQFREQVGDLEVHEYTADHCWTFRNWLDATKDEKKGEALAGKTKNNKLSAVSSFFSFAIERRFRNDNPMHDVKWFPKNENRKKQRRLYSRDELKALFIDNRPEPEYLYWAERLGLYAGLRLRESIQLRPEDVSHEFGVWHLIVRPGRGQSVKGDRARVVPVHKELIRLGLVRYAQRAQRQRREWLFPDVPLVEGNGEEFNAPDLDRMMVPSANAAGKAFGYFSDQCGVTDPNLDFHALRGAFVTYGSQLGKNLSLRMEIVGHSKGSDVHSTYIYAGSALKDLKREIDKVKYPIQPR